MNRHQLRVAACLMLACLAAPAISAAHAQALDSISVAMDSRYRWRSYDRGDGLVARTALSFALGGFATTHAPGDPNNWRFDLSAINPLSQRDARRAFDQYQASLGYGRCLAACNQGEWIKRLTLNVSANGYSLPHAAGDRTTTELEITLRGYTAIEKIGERQFGGNLYPFITVDRDFQRYRATYARAGAGTYMGPFGAFSLLLDGAFAVSDWPMIDGAERAFGFHGADLQLGLDYFRTLGDRHLSVRFIWGVEVPQAALGAKVGLLTLRLKLSGPVLMFR